MSVIAFPRHADVVVARADHVTRVYGLGPRAVIAIRDVTCVLRAGDQVALTGPSGSGKTTLLHLLAGLDEPTSGIIEWPAIGSRARLRPGPVGVVFQGPSLLPPLTVVENVELVLLLRSVDRRIARRRALAALDRLDLGQLAGRLPDDLSGGQAQRVAVARAVAAEPQLILADEPTGQLDHQHATTVIDTLRDAARQLGATLVVNTHDPTIAERFPQCWAMNAGCLDTPSTVPS